MQYEDLDHRNQREETTFFDVIWRIVICCESGGYLREINQSIEAHYFSKCSVMSSLIVITPSILVRSTVPLIIKNCVLTLKMDKAYDNHIWAQYHQRG